MDLIFLLLLFAVLVVLMVRRLPLFIALGVTVVLGFFGLPCPAAKYF